MYLPVRACFHPKVQSGSAGPSHAIIRSVSRATLAILSVDATHPRTPLHKRSHVPKLTHRAHDCHLIPLSPSNPPASSCVFQRRPTHAPHVTLPHRPPTNPFPPCLRASRPFRPTRPRAQSQRKPRRAAVIRGLLTNSFLLCVDLL